MFIELDPQGNEIIVQPTQIRNWPVLGNERFAVDGPGIVPLARFIVRFHWGIFSFSTHSVGTSILDPTSRYRSTGLGRYTVVVVAGIEWRLEHRPTRLVGCDPDQTAIIVIAVGMGGIAVEGNVR